MARPVFLSLTSRQKMGVTLVELLVAVGVISISLVGIMALKNYSSKQVMALLQKSDFIRVLVTIQGYLLDRWESIPIIETEVFDNFNFEEFKRTFDRSGVSRACFDRQGLEVAWSEDPQSPCMFKVWYYRSLVKDRLFSDVNVSNFDQAFMSRIVFKIQFRDIQTNLQKEYYFSRLKTHILSL